MSSKNFSSLEIDAIGEILNISLGASATAVSTMLSRRVDITTPSVSVVNREDFQFKELEPAIGVEITYVSGISGSNLMLLKRHDVKVICEILMGIEIAEDEFELNEMNLSAVCEVMNQMMGASSTALSEFLGDVVNISTPVSFEIEDLESFKAKYFGDEDEKVVAYFKLNIENAIESQFMNLMSISLAKRLLSAFNLEFSKDDDDEEESSLAAASSGGTLSQEEIEKRMDDGNTAPESAAASSGGTLSQEEIEKLMGGGAAETAPQTAQPQAAQPQGMPGMPPQGMPPQGMPPQGMQGMPPQDGQNGYPPYGMYSPYGMYPSYGMPPQDYGRMPRMVSVKPMDSIKFDVEQEQLGTEQAENLSMIMDVPLEISVEIGRTQKNVKDILELNKGSLVVLDKLAGEQVDIYANGQCIAKGDVVVVEDNFGVRITEIVKNPDLKLTVSMKG